MKRSTRFVLAAGILAGVATPGFVVWQHMNQMQERLIQTQAEAAREAQATQESLKRLEQEREAAQRQAEQTAQAAQQQAEQLEQQRAAAAAAQQQENLVNQTAEAWRSLTITLENVNAGMSQANANPIRLTATAANELAAIPIEQIDPKLAALVQDYRKVFYDINQVLVNYQTQQEKLGASVVEASRFGCDTGQAFSSDEQAAASCVWGGLLGGGLSLLNSSAESQKLEAEFKATVESLSSQFGSLQSRKTEMVNYLSNTYSINTL